MRVMDFRATVTVRRNEPISDEDYSRVLAALDRRHEELGSVGGGGTRHTAMFVMSTDRHALPAPAAWEMLEGLRDALADAGMSDTWPVGVEVEAVDPGAEDVPRVASG
jgi:hypothetical protein